MPSRVRSWDSGVNVRARCPGRWSPTAVSTSGTGPVPSVRTRAQRCRRRQFASGHVKTGRARGIQHPRVTAHGFARGTDRPDPDDTSQTPKSSYLRPTARRVRLPKSGTSDRTSAHRHRRRRQAHPGRGAGRWRADIVCRCARPAASRSVRRARAAPRAHRRYQLIRLRSITPWSVPPSSAASRRVASRLSSKPGSPSSAEVSRQPRR